MNALTLEKLTPAALEGLTVHVEPFPDALDANELIKTTRTITAVASRDDYDIALRYAGDAAAMDKKVLAHFEPYCKSAKALHTALVALRDKPSGLLKDEKARLTSLALAYQQKIEREQREERLRAEREEQVRRDAQQKKIEDQARLEREALELERKQLAERAAEQAAAGNARAAAEAQRLADAAQFEADCLARQTATLVEDLQAEPIEIDHLVPAGPKPSDAGSSTRTDYIVDEERINLRDLVTAAVENWEAYGQYLMVNLSACKSAAKTSKGKCNIPGVPVRAKQGISVKASK